MNERLVAELLAERDGIVSMLRRELEATRRELTTLQDEVCEIWFIYNPDEMDLNWSSNSWSPEQMPAHHRALNREAKG